MTAPPPIQLSGSSRFAFRVIRALTTMAWWIGCGLPVLLVAAHFIRDFGEGGDGARLQSGFTFPVNISIHEPSFEVFARSSAPDVGAAQLVNLRGDLSVAESPWGPAQWIVAVLMYVMGLSILWLVRRIVRSLDETPFEPRNAGRIRAIAFLLLGFIVPGPLLAGLQHRWLVERFHPHGVTLSIESNIDLGSFFLPFLLLVIAEVFRRGGQLEQGLRNRETESHSIDRLHA